MPLLNKISRVLHCLSLDRMVAPLLIRGVYWIGILTVISAVIGSLFSQQPGFGALLTLVAAGITLLFWRLFCELLILAFNIYIRLTEIRDLLATRQTSMNSRRAATSSNLKGSHLNPLHKVQHD